MDQWIEIRKLSLAGMSIRAIAHRLRLCRNTVRKALRRREVKPEGNKRKRARFLGLKPFQEVCVQMLTQGLIGTRILHELRKLGYSGGQSSLYRFLSVLKAELPRPRQKAAVRFETPPGKQAQFDWSPYRVVLGGTLTKVIIYNFILAYSRRKFYWPSLRETQEAVFEALEAALWECGGCPAEILVDNAKVFVKDARPSHFQWNPQFLAILQHYGMVPLACQVRRPQTKGKVERPFYYLEQHFIKGRTFLNFEDFTLQLRAFTDEVNHRVHQTLGAPPWERFVEEEREHLQGLPPGRFFGPTRLFRKVTWDSLIAFDGSRYSVPFAYAGKEVSLKVSQGISLEVHSSQGERIAFHRLVAKRGSVVIEPAHYEGWKKQLPWTFLALKHAFLEAFPCEERFLEKLIAQYKWGARAHLRAILDLVPIYPKEAIRQAFSTATQYNTFSCHVIKGLLEKTQAAEEETLPLLEHIPIPKFQFSRSLGDYNKLIEAERRNESWNPMP